MLTMEAFRKAAVDLDGITVRTPLLYAPFFSDMTGHRVYLKTENLQRTGSFKLRGAYNKLSGMSRERLRKGVITASSGNHGQAVAFAARLKDAPCTVVMPVDAVPAKVEATRGHGAEILMHGTYPGERKELALRLASERGLTYIDSTDDEAVMAGQGTLALEIMEDIPTMAVVITPVGGGGLASGVSTALKMIEPRVRVIAAEPERSCSMCRSVEAGEPVEVEVSTMADGLRCRKPGRLPFTYIRDNVDEFALVSEEAIARALVMCLDKMKLLVEPSGAVSLAALLGGAVPGAGRNVAVILSGGNADAGLVARLLRNYATPEAGVEKEELCEP